MEQEPNPKPPHRSLKIALVAGAVCLAVAGSLAWVARQQRPMATEGLVHNDITTTVFWVGEPADNSNAGIHNRSSTWVEDWEGEFGGVDDPKNRCDKLPCGFTPQENPYYFALPYNDLEQSCQAKASQTSVPWFNGPPAEGNSIIKNRWIKIQFAGKIAFAQWEDAGPLGEDDVNYVFGSAAPNYQPSGLDISPATAEYLNLDGRGQTSWEFVDEQEVPDGPWRKTITSSPPDCAR